jgi:hypothetical protein
MDEFQLARNLSSYFCKLRPFNIHLLEPSFTLTPNVLAYHNKFF